MRRCLGLLCVALIASACARSTPVRVATLTETPFPEVLVETRAVRVGPAALEVHTHGIQPGVVSGDQAAALLRTWEAAGVEDLSPGGPLLVVDGQQATLFVGEVVEIQGERVELGQRLAVSVTIHPQVDRITLDFAATWRRVSPEAGGVSLGAGPPRVEELALRSRADLPDGGWLLLSALGSAGDAVLALVHVRVVAR